MKKTFGKRFISGMTSAALAASFVFGAFPGVSSVLMTSSAEAVTGFERDNTDNSLSAQNTNAKINFKSASGESVSVTTSDNTYYLLVHAQGKDSDLFGVTFKYFEEGESKDAYDLIEINAEGTDWTSPAFSLWQTRVSAAELWGSWTEREIVPDIVTMDGTFLKNSDPSKDLTLSDAIGGRNCTVVDNIDGMELNDAGYSGYSSYGGTFYFDAVGGKISPAKYSVELSFDAPTTITEDDNIYLFIESDTSSTDYKYVLEKLTVNGERSKNIDITDWYDSNGNSPEGGEYYDGSATKVTLLRSSVSDLSINNAVNRSNCGEIANGGFFNGSSVKYGRQTKVDADIPEYTEHISFTKASSVTGYNFRSILGEGLYYGMVIDRFEQGNHTESNYAVNFYEGNGQPNTPDISGKFGGHFYFAEFVHFNDEINDYAETSDYVNFDSKDFSIDPDGQFFIDNTAACCEDGAVLHFDSEDRMKETMDRDGIARKFEDKTTINGVIDPILKNMQAVSNELAGLPVNAAPTIMGGKAYISGAGYDDDAILVIDGDAIAPYIAESGKVHIELKGDQMVIFNFDEVTEARIDEFNIRRIGDADYQLSTTPSNENTLEHGKNYWLDQNATRNIVWNLKSVKALDINKATGIFLIPDEDSVTRIKGTSSGWLESAGYVNNPDGEWHFLYTDLPRNTTVVSVDKKDITGQEEVEGAQLKLYTADGEKMFSWESDGTTHKFRLAPGDYVLEETGDEFEDDGVIYKVIPSKVTFTVVADADETSYDCTIENVRGVESSIDEDSDTGYCLYNGNAKKFTVCDAEAVDTTKIIINKYDLTGQKEVANAKLKLTGTDSRGNAVSETWTSRSGKNWEVALADGEYTLEETGTSFTDTDGTVYEIIPSALTFSIVEGKIRSAASADAAVVSLNRTSDDGYYAVGEDAASGSTLIKVCDAQKIGTTDVTLRKTDITGENEVRFAKLEIFDEEGNSVDSWISDGTEHVIEGLVNGTYTLTEEAADEKKIIDDYGNEYDVVKSTVTFTVNNGKLTAVKENRADAVTTPKTGATESYVMADKSNNIITVCDAIKDAVIKRDVTINKTDITGEKEVKGAQLDLRVKGLEDDQINAIINANANNNTLNNWETYMDAKYFVMTWVSGEEAAQINGLVPGTYTLTETGDAFVYDGVTYEVMDSEVIFIIDDNGNISFDTVPAPSDERNPENSSEGYAKANGNTITICDASRSDITVSKKDITASEEVVGAHLVIKDRAGEVIEEWDSNGRDHIVKGLTNGTYILTETAVDSAKAGAEYEIIPSNVTFTVNNGKITDVYSSVLADSSDNNFDEGYVLCDEDSNTITVCDAKKKTTKVTITKTDITGTAEITGAVLTIKDSTGKNVTGTPWTSGRNGKELEVELIDGTYTLTETGTNIVDENGNEYDVIDSTLTFKVENGKVTEVTNETNNNNGEGFYEVDSDTNTITVNDAQKKTKVTINKFDITGSEELEGAVLTIKDSTGKTIG
ncbi:MSCRAMM family protein, partial [Ruminococcus albus]